MFTQDVLFNSNELGSNGSFENFENIYLITGNLRIMKLMRHNINAVREKFSLQLKLAYKKKVHKIDADIDQPR